MANILNQDFTDFSVALSQAEVEYVLVGGYAVIFHGYNRTTGGLDIWVNATTVIPVLCSLTTRTYIKYNKRGFRPSVILNDLVQLTL